MKVTAPFAVYHPVFVSRRSVRTPREALLDAGTPANVAVYSHCRRTRFQ